MAKVTLVNNKTKRQYKTTSERAEKAIRLHPGVFTRLETKGLSEGTAKIKESTQKNTTAVDKK